MAVSAPEDAELSKLLENTLRHANIALINELTVFASARCEYLGSQGGRKLETFRLYENYYWSWRRWLLPSGGLKLSLVGGPSDIGDQRESPRLEIIEMLQKYDATVIVADNYVPAFQWNELINGWN